MAVMESVFRGEDPSHGRGASFWDEVFLLKVNGTCIGRCISLVSEDTLLRNGGVTLQLMNHCVRVIEDKDPMRTANALFIVELFFRNVFRKKFSNFGFDVLNLVGGGFEAGDALFRRLVDAVLALLGDDSRAQNEHALAVELLLSLASGCENVAANSLIEYLHCEMAFEVLVKRLPQGRANNALVFRALLVALLIANYQKYEARNVFVGHFAALNDPAVQERLARVLSEELSFVREAVALRLAPPAPTGWFGSSAPAKAAAPMEIIRCAEGGALLGCYELCYLSGDFFLRTLLESHGVGWGDRQLIKGSVPAGPDLFRAHVELASALCIKVVDERGALHCKMSFLACVPFLEDSASLDVLHNPKFAWSTPLQIIRKTDNSAIVGSAKDHDIPAICWLLDVLLEFLKNNIHNNLQVRLHTLVMNMFHRVLCYQKQHHHCLKRFKWELLWKQMFRLLGFVGKEEWFKKPEVVELTLSITTILNLFITYGDTFLPSGNDYDYLYYELIREAKTLSAVSLLIEKYASDSALAQHMENIMAIVQHFKNRIDNWTKANDGAAISPEDVLSVIKRNYGSLKLVLLDGLDFYAPYSENPSQISFFRQYIRQFVADVKPTIKNE